MDVEPLLAKAEFCLELGQYHEAIDIFTLVLSEDSENVDALIGRGICRFKILQYDTSIMDLRKAVSLDGDCSRAYYFLGRVYTSADQVNDAIQMFSRAIEIENDDYLSYNRRAELYADLKEFNLAINDYSRGIEAGKGTDDSLYSRGLLWMEVEHWEEAIKDFLGVSEAFQNRAILFFNLSIAEGKLGLIEEEIAHLIKSINLNPIDWDAYLNLGLCYLENDQISKAMETFKAIVDGDPDSLNATNALKFISDINNQK